MPRIRIDSVLFMHVGCMRARSIPMHAVLCVLVVVVFYTYQPHMCDLLQPSCGIMVELFVRAS